MPFCPNCGRETQSQANFCPACGAELAAVPVTSNPVETPGELPYHISLNRIVLMTVLSQGLYLFYWFYLTWKQYRDHTGDVAYPVWHVLTMYVPIYELFRIHAHARTYRDLMRLAGVASSIKAWLAVVLWFISVRIVVIQFCISVTLLSDEARDFYGAVPLLGILGFAIGLVIALLWHLQSNINRYWRGFLNARVTSARIGVGEIIFAIIGVLAWAAFVTYIFR